MYKHEKIWPKVFHCAKHWDQPLFKARFLKSEGKWLLSGSKRHTENQLQNLELTADRWIPHTNGQ